MKQFAKLCRILSKPVLRDGLRHGVGAAMQHADLLGGLSLATVVDIGANVGQFSLLVNGLMPHVHVHAFEPVSKSARTFERLFAKNEMVSLHQKAVGRIARKLAMNIARHADSSSLLPATPLQSKTFSGTDFIGVEEVEVTPLDLELAPSQIVPPALLKLDVQGYELEALRGCESMIRLFSYVYFELSFVELYVGQATPEELFDFLGRNGFSFRGVYNTVYDKSGRSIQCDCLFAADAPHN